MHLYLTRLWFWLWRLQSLARAKKFFTRYKGPSILSVKFFSYQLWLDTSKGSPRPLLALDGERFMEERRLLLDLLKPGMKVVDVGANIGYCLVLFESAVGPGGKVFCIEPSPENIPELELNIRNNAFENVELHKVALGAKTGTAGLRSGINSGVAEVTETAYTVPILPLDSLIQEKVDFVKIDVEGYEGQVIAGAEGLLRRDRPILFLEVHPFLIQQYGITTRELLKRLESIYGGAPSACYYMKDHAGIAAWMRVLVRYFEQFALGRITDLDSFVARCDRGDVSHTFWAIYQ